MLSPDMIREDIRYGEELETQNENYKAYWVYMYAESAVEREDEAICLRGSQKDFAEAEDEANRHRRRVWKYLTDEEKEFARRGKNPFYNPIDYQGFPKSFIPYNLGGYYIDYVSEDKESDECEKIKPSPRKDSFGASLILIMYFFLHPFRFFKRQK